MYEKTFRLSSRTPRILFNVLSRTATNITVTHKYFLYIIIVTYETCQTLSVVELLKNVSSLYSKSEKVEVRALHGVEQILP